MEIPTDHLNKMSIEEFDTSKLLINAARQRDQRKLQDELIIDVDCHHYENESMSEIVEFIGILFYAGRHKFIQGQVLGQIIHS